MMPAVTYYRTTLCPNASYKITAGAVATFSRSIVIPALPAVTEEFTYKSTISVKRNNNEYCL